MGDKNYSVDPWWNFSGSFQVQYHCELKWTPLPICYFLPKFSLLFIDCPGVELLMGSPGER